MLLWKLICFLARIQHSVTTFATPAHPLHTICNPQGKTYLIPKYTFEKVKNHVLCNFWTEKVWNWRFAIMHFFFFSIFLDAHWIGNGESHQREWEWGLGISIGGWWTWQKCAIVHWRSKFSKAKNSVESLKVWNIL